MSIICSVNAFNSLRPSDAYMRRSSNHHWFRQWLVAWTAPSHYLNQSWNIVNWTLGNKLQWNCNRNSNIFIEENTFENVVCEMLFISSRPQSVKKTINLHVNLSAGRRCLWRLGKRKSMKSDEIVLRHAVTISRNISSCNMIFVPNMIISSQR